MNQDDGDVGSSALLGTHLNQLSWRYSDDDVEQLGHERQKIRSPIALRHENDDPQLEAADVLLERKVAVDGHEDIEVDLGERQQFSIPLAGPVHFRNRPHVVADQVALEALWQALIKQNAHGRVGRLWPVRAQLSPALD